MQLRELSLLIVLSLTVTVDAKIDQPKSNKDNTTIYEKGNKCNAWQNDYAERVQVIRPNIKHLDREQEEVIPFESITEYSDEYLEGDVMIKQDGINGKKTMKYRDTFEDDILRRTVLVGEIVSIEVQNEIRVVGTQKQIQEQTEVDAEPTAQSRVFDIPVDNGYHNDSVAYQMFDAINAYRSTQGLPAYQWSSQLESYASVRAQELQYLFDHTRPDGSSWDSLNPDVIYAENLAMQAYRVETAMDSFIASPTHNDNLLADYPYAAVSVFEASDGEWYWVQLFGY